MIAKTALNMTGLWREGRVFNTRPPEVSELVDGGTAELRAVPSGTFLNPRTAAEQKREAVPRRARI